MTRDIWRNMGTGTKGCYKIKGIEYLIRLKQEVLVRGVENKMVLLWGNGKEGEKFLPYSVKQTAMPGAVHHK